MSRKQTKNSKLSWLKSHIFNVAGLTLVIAGVLAGAVSYVNIWNNQHSAVEPKPLSQVINSTVPNDNGEKLVSGTPVRIQVPSVNIDLKVIPGYYYPESNSWTLSLDNAQFATMTAKANNKQGNTFIYAHARLNVFHDLPKVESGAKAIVTTDSGQTFTYTFVNSAITKPNDTTLFSYKGKSILTLQTCTGTRFENRQLFVFDFAKVG